MISPSNMNESSSISYQESGGSHDDLDSFSDLGDNPELEDDEEDEDEDDFAEISPGGRYSRVSSSLTQFHELFGQGAFKNVYKAVDKETGCEVAWSTISTLNMTPSKIPADPEQSTRLDAEISLLLSINHPNIISLLDFWRDDGHEKIIFITKMITGGSLSNHL